MQFSTKTSAPEKTKTGCAIVPVIRGELCGDAARAIDRACGGKLSALLKQGDLADKAGSTLLTHLDGGISRVLLVSLGKSDDSREVSEKSFKDAASAVKSTFKTSASVTFSCGCWRKRTAKSRSSSITFKCPSRSTKGCVMAAKPGPISTMASPGSGAMACTI